MFVQIFTDGACDPNPGRGGWGAIVRIGRVDTELSGFDPTTTNNRMELMGAIKGIESLDRPGNVVVFSDSKYVVNGGNSWMPRWRKHGWSRSAHPNSKPLMNVDLWQRLDRAMSQHKVRFQWVRGHNGHVDNERADALAVQAMLSGTRAAA